MNENILKYLSDLGYTNVNSNYYSHIEVWEDYWKNNCDYITYRDFYGVERKMYTLGMAKTLSEDWASVLWSEEDEITSIDNKTSEKIWEISQDFDLENRIPEAIENACWSGTCGALIRLKNAVISKSGIISANDRTKKELILVNAKNIIPLKVEHNKIVDVAFASNVKINGKGAIYLEVHTKGNNGYEIRNIYFDEETGKLIKNDEIIEVIYTGSDKPWFSILTPAKNNPVKNSNGLGFSIYGNSLDQIRACDIAYNNFVMDFFLGGKKIIYNKKLIRYKQISYKDSDGTTKFKEVPMYPDDISKQQFMEIGGDESSINDKELLHEYNPELRIEDNQKGIQLALNVLSRKVQLGDKYYSFENGTIVTATQFVGDRQDFVKNAKKFRRRLNKFIENIIRTTLNIEKSIFGNNEIKEDDEILIGSTDGFMVDQETEREQARQDYAMGVISLVEYRMRVFKETEEEAIENVRKINEQYEVKEVSEEEK